MTAPSPTPQELPEEIATAIEELAFAYYSHGLGVGDGTLHQIEPRRSVEARSALTAAILSRLGEAEAENTRLRERLEDKTRSIRVEIAAKLAAYNDIKLLEAEAREAADAMESVAKKLRTYSPPAEMLFRRAWSLRALLSEAPPQGEQ